MLRLAQRSRADGGSDYFRLTDGQAEATPFVSVGFEDSQTTQPQHIAADGLTIYWTDSRGRDKAALVAQNLSTGSTRVVAEDTRADIGSALYHPQTGQAQAYAADYLKSEYVALDPVIQSDLKRLHAATPGTFTITSRSDDDNRWLVEMDPVTAPSSTWLYDRRAQSLSKIYVSRPEMEGAPLAPMQPLEIKSRDGLTLVSYLTLPLAANPDGDGKAHTARADGADRPRRTVGPRRLGLQPLPPVARQPRLRRAVASTTAARPASARTSSTPPTANGPARCTTTCSTP